MGDGRSVSVGIASNGRTMHGNYGTGVWNQSIVVGLGMPSLQWDDHEARIAFEETRTNAIDQRVERLEARIRRSEQALGIRSAGGW